MLNDLIAVLDEAVVGFMGNDQTVTVANQM